MDNVEKSDVRSETLKIFILELDVIQRSAGGKLGETEERADGVDRWTRRMEGNL